MTKYSQEQVNEARILAHRFGLKFKPVLNWMRKNNLYTILDVKQRFPGSQHEDSMRLVINDIWQETCNPTTPQTLKG